MTSNSIGAITYGLPKLRDDQGLLKVQDNSGKSSQTSGVFSPADQTDLSSQIATAPYIEIALNTQDVPNVTSPKAGKTASFQELGSIITEVRYMRGVRMVEEAIMADNKGKWPDDLSAAEFGTYVDKANISDPTIKPDIKARFAEYETTNAADPEDPSSKYNDYSAHGKWVMVYNSYRDSFLGMDKSESVSFDNLFARLKVLNSGLSKPYAMPQDPASLDIGGLAKHVAGLLVQGGGRGETCNALEILMIADVMANRYRKGARMVEEAIMADNKGKWPNDLTAAEFGTYVDKANISDPAVKKNIKARFAEYETNNVADPEDPGSKYNDYGAHGKWVMVYNSYRDGFLATDDLLSDMEKKLGPEAASSCGAQVIANRESDLPWVQLKAIWGDYIARVYASMGAPLSVEQRAVLDDLLERGHNDPSDRSTGITAKDVMMLTKAVEMSRLKGKRLLEFNYDDNALKIHTVLGYVPDGLASKDIGITAVFYKMDVAGIKLKGIRTPVGVQGKK